MSSMLGNSEAEATEILRSVSSKGRLIDVVFNNVKSEHVGWLIVYYRPVFPVFPVLPIWCLIGRAVLPLCFMNSR